jgi:fyn-related kinase
MDSEEWFKGKIKRASAEKMLRSGPPGIFLIRESESREGEFSLSVSQGGERIKHYRICQNELKEYYITKRATFTTIKEVVDHYQHQQDGLCVQLTDAASELAVAPTGGLSKEVDKNWEIDRRTITLKKKLGQGQFGDVWLGVWNGVKDVAVKTMKPGTMDVADFLEEASILKRFRHPKLLQLYAVCTIGDPLYIVTEIMENGSLLDYLHKTGKSLKVTSLVEMSAQIASGMAYLEQNNVIHRDLAARNVLVGINNICKVADFGLARAAREDIYNAREGAKFPIKWTAPEAAMMNKFSIKSDVWSFGILLVEIVTYGRIPYPGMTNAEVLQQVDRGCVDGSLFFLAVWAVWAPL